MNFDLLPQELLEEVFSHVTRYDAGQLRLVSRDFERMATPLLFSSPRVWIDDAQSLKRLIKISKDEKVARHVRCLFVDSKLQGHQIPAPKEFVRALHAQALNAVEPIRFSSLHEYSEREFREVTEGDVSDERIEPDHMVESWDQRTLYNAYKAFGEMLIENKQLKSQNLDGSYLATALTNLRNLRELVLCSHYDSKAMSPCNNYKFTAERRLSLITTYYPDRILMLFLEPSCQSFIPLAEKALGQITSISLDLSATMSSMPGYYELRLVRLLAATPQLEHLAVRRVPELRMDKAHMDSINLKYLKSIDLERAVLDAKTFEIFLHKHRVSLKRIALKKTALIAGTFESLFTCIRDALKLEELVLSEYLIESDEPESVLFASQNLEDSEFNRNQCKEAVDAISRFVLLKADRYPFESLNMAPEFQVPILAGAPLIIRYFQVRMVLGYLRAM
ncbi:MAG: hypothetical protein M1818_008027 [Claussenomyces sp. TS43310]|nr:MAG: hypothetical protein M1818_008027 [Claussenomyces sp. TS43310]